MSAAGSAKQLLKHAFVRLQGARIASRTWSWRVLPRGLRRPHEVVTEFDVHAYQAELVDTVSAVLTRAGVEHLILDERLIGTPRVVINRAVARAARRALAGDPATRTWWLAGARLGSIGRAVPLAWHLPAPAGVIGLLLCRNLVTAAGAQLVDSETGVLLEYWQRHETDQPATGGGVHLAGTLRAPASNGVLDYAGPVLWAQIQRDGHRLPARPPHLLLVNEPVDLVYTWVDGADPAWRRRRAGALGEDVMAQASVDAAIDARFESRDELRYSLRSVQMFANWVNRIWIVTDQQVPSWLQQDERLRVVDHREIYADPSVLPVYNSHSIESQLHHIPGLAEHYLYLNDDMLFGAPVQPEDFFHGNRVSKFFTSPALLDVGPNDPRDLAVASAAKNNRTLIEAQFGRTITQKLRHTPQPQLRSLIERFEADHPEIFDSVMRSPVRQPSNFSLPSSLNQYYAFALGRAVPGRLRYEYLDLGIANPEVTLAAWLLRRRNLTICINDSGDDSPEQRRPKEIALRAFFEEYYPLPSRWERP